MSLEERLHRKKVVIRKTPSSEVLQKVRQGSKFIIVENDFDHSQIPRGYTFIDMKYKGESFKTLIPQSLLFYMAHPGEGSVDDALNELADFYGEAEDFEDDMIERGNTSVQGANWATLSRDNYKTYLINKLVSHKRGERDKDGEPVPEFDQDALKVLDLNDDYVGQRVRAMAALMLDKKGEELNKYDIKDVLKHVTISENRVEKLTQEEFKKITCWAGSHYEIKDEYRKRDDVVYDIERRHNMNHMVGTKTIKKVEVAVLDRKVEDLEKEIEQHRIKKHGEVGRHDAALIRTYANLAYIAKEDPNAQLDVYPKKERRE